MEKFQYKNEDTHQLADGRKVLITHGDEFDAVIINARWLAKVGSALYEYLLKLNNVFNLFEERWVYLTGHCLNI